MLLLGLGSDLLFLMYGTNNQFGVVVPTATTSDSLLVMLFTLYWKEMLLDYVDKQLSHFLISGNLSGPLFLEPYLFLGHW